jgi:hypothetical protein
MAGAITAAAIGGAAVLGGAYMSSRASKSAADTQADSAQKAMDLQQPFLQNGYIAQNRLMDVLGMGPNTTSTEYGIANRNFSPTDLTNNMDPGYGFRFGEGMKALNATAAARGGALSGNALRGATEYGQNAASQEYANAFNRYQTNRSNLLNPLQSLAGVGMTAAGNIGNIGMQGANATASGQVGSANAINNGINQGVSQYQTNSLINKIFADKQQQGLVNQYGANNLYGAGQANYQPNMPTTSFIE